MSGYWGNRRPPFGTPIDPTHPMVYGHGLVGYWLASQGMGNRLVDLVSGQTALAFSGSPTWAAGLSTTAQGQAAYGAAAPAQKPTTTLTVMFQGRPTAAATNASWFGCTYQGLPDAAPYWAWMLGPNNAHSAFDFTLNRSGSGTSLNSSGTGPIPTTGVRTQLAGVIRFEPGAINQAIRMFKDGFEVAGTGSLPASATTVGYGTAPVIGFGDITNFTASNFVHDFGAIFATGLPNNLLAWYAAEPFDMFQAPVTRRAIVLLPAASGVLKLAGVGGGLAERPGSLAG